LLNDIILGVLGRAQRLYPLEVVAYSFLSNHHHLLLRVEMAERLSDFMRYFSGNVAREIARLTGWENRIWARRYDAILITEEEEAQVKRLAYVLSNCVKENLVARVEEWPGVHCARPLLTGETWRGLGSIGGWSTTPVCEERSPGYGISRDYLSTRRPRLRERPYERHIQPSWLRFARQRRS
jgi:REP element-mobilizing transposase RayT